MAASPESPFRPWSDLLPELLGHVIARLPFPADRARLRAVCRGWRSAAAEHVRQLPWLVMPDGSFCTIGDDGVFFPRGTIPGVPADATCVGSTDGWLVLDRTDDVHRRTKFVDTLFSPTYKKPSRDVNHKHSYLLHNPFSGATVPLPELDDVIGHVSEMFKIQKVLMRSSAPDDVIAITTNSINCNIILCRPGKGVDILTYFRICDIAFVEEWLYGITPDEDLLAFRIGEDDDGKPIFIDYRRVIKHPLADGEKDPWSWMDVNDNDDNDDDGNDNDGDDDDGDEDNDDGGGDDNNGEAPTQEVEDKFNGDAMIPDDDLAVYNTEPPYEGYICTTRKLVKSQSGELLLVRRQVQEPPFTRSYTRNIEIFKVDVNIGKWIPVFHDGLAQNEVLFLSHAFCKSSLVFGDVKAGFIYADDTNEIFDTTLLAPIPFIMPWQRKQFGWMTWIFPPKLMV